MTKQTWIIACVLSILLLSGFVGLSFWQRGKKLERAREELATAVKSAELAKTENDALKSRIEESQSRIEELQKATEQANQAQKNLEHVMRNALQSKDITISELQGKLTVNILDRILFDSGESELKPEGTQVLDQVAKVLAQFPNRQIHVIGHTDNVPIRANARNKYASNWELSTTRATAAVRYLCEKAGVDPRRMGAVGYGEFHPIADNTTTEGRAKNRRIAIVVLSEELAGSDTANPVNTSLTHSMPNDSTNVAAPVLISTNSPASSTNIAIPNSTSP